MGVFETSRPSAQPSPSLRSRKGGCATLNVTGRQEPALHRRRGTPTASDAPAAAAEAARATGHGPRGADPKRRLRQVHVVPGHRDHAGRHGPVQGCRRLARTAGRGGWQATCQSLVGQGLVCEERGDHSASLALQQRAGQMYRSHGDRFSLARMLQARAMTPFPAAQRITLLEEAVGIVPDDVRDQAKRYLATECRDEGYRLSDHGPASGTQVAAEGRRSVQLSKRGGGPVSRPDFRGVH